jgi:3-deoxy-7-phosphoheptulonate synthase
LKAERALVDGPQALLLEEMPQFLEGVCAAREAHEKRVRLASCHESPLLAA